MRLNLTSIEITEESDQLKGLMNRELHPRKKERLQILHLIKNKLVSTLKDISVIIGRSKHHIAELLKIYIVGGLKALLCIHSPTGRSGSCSDATLSDLKVQLGKPRGFGSYGEIRQWLADNHQINLSYKAVWYLVNRKLKSRLKVARPQHIKQDEKKKQEFKDDFPKAAKAVEEQIKSEAKCPVITIHHWFQDESRFGLFTIKRRRITLKGVKPIGPMQHKFESYYLYSAVAPLTGDMFTLEMPAFDADCFQVFLDHFAQYDPNSFHVMWMDQASVHKAEKLIIPDNVRLELIPPYSPELNPVERVWEELKDQLAWVSFENLNKLRELIAAKIRNLSREKIKSLTGYPYIKKALENAQ